MTRYLDFFELIEVAAEAIESTPINIFRISKLEVLQAAAAAPKATFDGADLYPLIHEKAAVLGYQIARNHPLVDGNKRLAISATIQFLMINDLTLEFDIDDAEQIILSLAAGTLSREQFGDWIEAHMLPWAFTQSDAE